MEWLEDKLYLYHYYEFTAGPLRNLSELDISDAEDILNKLKRDKNTFAAERPPNYLLVRKELEQRIRSLFIKKGGQPKKQFPHYFVLGQCPWIKDWYKDGRELKIPVTTFNPRSISFTYGDSFPAMRFQDGKPYRGQVYTFEEIPKIVKMYGLPQEWNKDGEYGPERYIEVQVWDDEPLHYMKNSWT